jgi:hypothetical protein
MMALCYFAVDLQPVVCFQVHILVGGTLLLRATRPVPAGAELTTGSYLGPDLVAPVAVRRAALKAQYGFHCRCPRCRLEQRLFPTRR